MIRYPLMIAITSIAIISQPTIAHELKVEFEKENVVASRLEGNWQTNESLNKHLTGNPKSRPTQLSFKSDPTVATKVPEKYAQFFAEHKLKIYLAGYVNLDGKDCPFVLTNIRGNPHVMFWLERDGDPFGNGESFNVMLAVAKDTQNDLLFVGGDFNNQPFSAFERTKPDPEK